MVDSTARAREEAERLVVAALAAASMAARDFGLRHDSAPSAESDDPHARPHTFATGSADCCVCPVCRVISAVRDPSPEFAERLATGASDLAAGLATVMRAFSSAASSATGRSEQADADPWREATHEEPVAHQKPASRHHEAAYDQQEPVVSDPKGTTEPPGTKPVAKKVMAKKVAKKAVRPTAPPPVQNRRVG